MKRDTGVHPLAEELFAILTSAAPLELTEPIEILNRTGGPAIIIRNLSPLNPPAITLINDSTPTQPKSDIPKAEDLPGAGLPPPPAAAGGGIPGEIVSGGPGDTYLVDLFELGLDKSATRRVTVIQMQIDPMETIPAGTRTFVSGPIGGKFYMQVPVFL